MPFISVTRLRIRSVQFLPAFALHLLRTVRQLATAPGFQAGSLLADRSRTFWTLTAWDAEASMRGYMTAGSHRMSMPRLVEWCDEASLVHWEQPEPALPDWVEAARRLGANGRPSNVLHPGPAHAGLGFPPPRTVLAVPIRSASRARSGWIARSNRG